MNELWAGLLIVFVFYALFLFGCFAVVTFLPASFLGSPAKVVLSWVPPFLGGEALRQWAAAGAERITREQLAGERSAAKVERLAVELEDAAMQAMLPLASPEERARVVACPKTGQGLVGVSAPEALAIAAYIRKHLSRAEQQRIYETAVRNATRIASSAKSDEALSPLPCALQGKDHVCCVYASRPLRCRPLHAIAIAKESAGADAPSAAAEPQATPASYEATVVQGMEMGVARALKAAGLEANVYELNSAVAAALGTSDAAERWARGESVFQNPLR